MNNESIESKVRLFGSKIMELLKVTTGGYQTISKMVAQDYGNNDAAYNATKVPTVLLFTQCLILSLAASFDHMSPHIRISVKPMSSYPHRSSAGYTSFR